MSEQSKKETYYYIYCIQCANKSCPETEDPCNECLSQPYNFNSHKPVKFVPTKKKRDRKED